MFQTCNMLGTGSNCLVVWLHNTMIRYTPIDIVNNYQEGNRGDNLGYPIT